MSDKNILQGLVRRLTKLGGTLFFLGTITACAQSPAPASTEPITTPPVGTIREACLSDARTLCPDEFASRDRRAIAACLRQNRTSLSPGCGAAFEAQRQARVAGAPPPGESRGNSIGQEFFYVEGSTSDAFSLRYAGPTCSEKSPLVVFIHGGAWSIGDKDSGAGSKASHFTEAGYAFATVNFRMRPDVEVAAMVQDIANAIAWLAGNADDLGFDADNIILQGHSSGAHLAALLALDSTYLVNAGVDPASIRIVSLLDGAGYDIERQVQFGGNGDLYRSVFGEDTSVWNKMSPLTYAERGESQSDFVIHYVDGRRASEIQSKALAEAISRTGKDAIAVAALGKTHASLNRQFGAQDDVPTQEVTEFMQQRVPPCRG